MKAIETKFITAAQYNRLLLNSLDKEILTSQYGLKTTVKYGYLRVSLVIASVYFV